jgi:hypothetical protein
MAEKISVTLELLGGELVKQSLAEIGETGTKAFKDIDEAAKAVGGYQNLDPVALTDKFKALGIDGPEAINNVTAAVTKAGQLEVLAGGIKKVENAFDTLGTAVERVGTRMTRALGPLGIVARSFGPAGIAIGALGGAFLKFGHDAANSINQVDAAAAKLGVSFQQFDKLRAGFEQAGISSEAMTDGLQKLKTQGFDLATAIPQIIAQLQAMPDGVNRTNTAIELLGDKLGVELVAALRTGSLSLEKFNAAQGTLTETQRNTANQYQQSLNQLSAAWTRFKEDVATPVAIPLFDSLQAGLAGVQQGIATTKREWDTLKNVLTAITPKVGIDISLTGSLQSQLDAAKAKLDQIGQAGQQAAQQGTIAFTSWGEAIRMVSGQGQPAAQALQQAGQAGTQAGQQVAQGMNTATQGVEQLQRSAAGILWDSFAESAGRFGQAAVTSFNQIVSAVQSAATAVGSFASSLGGVAWDAISSAGVAAWDALIAKVQEYINLVLKALGLAAGGAPAASGGGGEGAARGGLMGGRGTGTSDSNLAWVSRGEHIMPARAVRQPGVLAFLEALRRSGGNLSRVLDGMGRFALGGLVPRPMPAFAAGGLNGGMSNVTIQFPGLPEIGGLRASSSAVDELRKAAALAQVRSGGRKPSRYS